MNIGNQERFIGPLRYAAEEVNAVNVENGWFEEDRTFGDGIALIHSEVSEALEAYRDHGFEDPTVKLCLEKNFKGRESEHNSEYHICKPEGVGPELADVLIRLLDEAMRSNVDLGREFFRKMAYNRTRGHRHGGKRL